VVLSKDRTEKGSQLKSDAVPPL